MESGRDGDRDRGRDRDRDGDEGGRHDERRPRGPEGTEFLDLEITKVLAAEAEGLAREAARELVREALRERLRERIGPELERIGHLAADRLADDLEANLAIEDVIVERKEKRRAQDESFRAAMSSRRRDGRKKR
jgi:hypothetical protein